MSERASHWTVICLVLVLLATGVPRALGQKAADRALKTARAAVAKGDHPGALRILRTAVRESPAQGSLWLTMGQAYNALRLFERAHHALLEAQKLGVDTPELHQQLGDALLGLGRFDEALAELRKGPNTARNRMGRAIALMALRHPEQALGQLDAAVGLAPALEPKVRLLRAAALAQMDRRAEAKEELNAGRPAASKLGLRHLYETFAATRALPGLHPAAKWGFRVTLGTGYNDNVTLQPDEATGVVAQELSNEGDCFVRESASAWFRLVGDQEAGIIAQAGFGATQHGDLDEFDDTYANGGLLAHCVVGPLSLEAGVDFGHTEVDYDTYAHTWMGYAAVRWPQGEHSRTNLTWQLSYRDFRFPVLDEENRDGPLHLVRVTQEFSLPVLDRRVYVAPYAEYGREDTQGMSSENDFWGVGGYVRCPLVRRLDGFASAGYRDRDYDHTHVRSAFVTKRSDHEWRLGAGLQYALSDHAYLTAEWNHVNQNSNLPEFFSFEQDVFLLSVTFHGP